jgi:long-chain fatty acid transport protein
MWGTAGMGVDYRDEAANFKMVTNLQLMQFGVPLTYAISGFSVGITPILQYGALDINYDVGTGSTGAGIAQDLAFGVNVGAAYQIAGVTIGASYKSQIDMEYKGQLTAAMAGFGVPYDNDKLSTPAELGVGVSYAIAGNTIALDVKQIKWSDAKGYEDFAWDDQTVYALGYEYAADAWAARIGYNYAKSPISDQGIAGTLVNTMNLLGFPAIVESHVSLGGTYAFSKQTSVDLAYVYALEATDTYTVSNNPNPGTREIETTHSQQSVSVQLNYNF